MVIIGLIRSSSEQAVLDTAYDGAATLALATNLARIHYSKSSVSRIDTLEPIKVVPDYRRHLYGIPNPATFAIELGEELSSNSKYSTVRMYSNYPFPSRQDTGGPQNEIEQQALAVFDQKVAADIMALPYTKVVKEHEKRVLYYIEPIVMTQSCVDCHNTIETSPKMDWQVGDVRGALSVRQVLVRSMAMQGILNFGYFGISALWFFAIGTIWFVDYRSSVLAKKNSQKYLHIASTDSLTELLNRRGFDRFFRQCWSDSKSASKSLAILYCDIDNFKVLNDTFGHAEGDACLKNVASVIRSQLRSKMDAASRWGGDEIVILLQDTDLEGALLIAERISRQVREKFKDPEMSMSIGVSAAIPHSRMEEMALIEKADEALYRAKLKSNGAVVGLSGLLGD